jgi:hypothetical protein
MNMTEDEYSSDERMPPGDYKTEYNPDGTLKGFEFLQEDDEARPSPEDALTELGSLDEVLGDVVRTYLQELQAFVARIATLSAGELGPDEVIKLRNEARRLIDWQNDAAQRKE